jgi:cyclase
MGDKNPYKNGGMFDGAIPSVFENAKQLWNTMTDAETVLWMLLKQRIDGCKFRRQHPIGLFIADFYCHKAKLVIEVDGCIHNLPDIRKNDEKKENYLMRNGYRVLRFTNKEIMTSIETVMQKITQTVNDNICKHSPNNGG